MFLRKQKMPVLVASFPDRLESNDGWILENIPAQEVCTKI